MESLDRIKQSVQKEAEDKKEKIFKEAEEKAESEKSASRKRAQQESNEIIQAGEEEADAMERRIISSARMKSRRRKLEAREEIIEKTFTGAMEELMDLREDQQKYLKTMENLIRDGGIAIGGGDLEVLVLEGDDLLSEEQVEKLSTDISEATGEDTSIKLLDELDSASGGAIVQKSDGSVRCDNTFEARLERVKDSLRTEVAEMLFESE